MPEGLNGHDESGGSPRGSAVRSFPEDNNNNYCSTDRNNFSPHRRRPLETEGPCCDGQDDENDDGDSTELIRHPSLSASYSVDEDQDGPSNKRLLGTAFVSFMSFALLQLSFAFVADSEAMKGDSAAMIVDALTYLFNYIAEERKHNFHFEPSPGLHPARAHVLRHRAYRKMALQMEVLPPLISVSTLLVVTAFVSYQAVYVFLHSTSEQPQENPDLKLMMAFSSLNLALDFLNVFCFAQAKHLTGFTTTDEATHLSATGQYVRAQSFSEHDASENQDDCDGVEVIERNHGSDMNGYSSVSDSLTQVRPLSMDSSERSHVGHNVHPAHEHTNLNMCSAYTHVFADTLRSIAVIVAASVAEFTPSVTPEEADASAALVVSGLIVLSLIPLFQGLLISGSELRSILAEEKSERLLLEQNQGEATHAEMT